MLREVLTTVVAVAQQPLAQVVLDRAGADPARLGQLLHLQQQAGLLWRHRRGRRARLEQRADLVLGVPGGRQHRRGCARPSAGPGPAGAPGVRDSLTGTPSRRTPSVPGWSISHDHLARAHQLRVERLVEAEHRLQAAVVLRRRTPCHSSRVRSREQRLHLGVRVRARALELLLDQVLAPDPAAPRLPELRLERAERDPAVLALVRPVTDQAPGQLEPAALRRLRLRPGSAPPPAPARPASRRTSTRPPAGPRRCARARAAPPGCRTRPSARRRRGRRSARRPGPAGRPRRRTAPAAR